MKRNSPDQVPKELDRNSSKAILYLACNLSVLHYGNTTGATWQGADALQSQMGTDGGDATGTDGSSK